MSKKIFIGADHAGLPLKNEVTAYLDKIGVPYTDFGTYTPDSVDYPVFADKVCKEVVLSDDSLGILICGTGIGMSIAANKHKGIRAACCSDTFSAKLTRMHNNANVLCFGARVVGVGLALELVDGFINTGYEGGRHQRRVDMLNDLDK